MVSGKVYKNFPLDSLVANEIRRILGGIGKLYLFGSRAKGTNRPFSDVDVCVVAEAVIPEAVLGAAKEQIQESSIPFKVDVVDIHAISDDFRSLIQSHWIEFP